MAGLVEGSGKIPVDVGEAGAAPRCVEGEELDACGFAIEDGEYCGNGVTGPSWERRLAKTGSRASKSMAFTYILALLSFQGVNERKAQSITFVPRRARTCF